MFANSINGTIYCRTQASKKGTDTMRCRRFRNSPFNVFRLKKIRISSRKLFVTGKLPSSSSDTEPLYTKMEIGKAKQNLVPLAKQKHAYKIIAHTHSESTIATTHLSNSTVRSD